MLIARPPRMSPTLAVVSASSRPSRLDAVRPGRAREDDARRVAVEDEPAPRADAIHGEMTGAEEAHLFADREHDLERRMAEPLLAAGAHALADDREAGLVVAAEHGRAV